MSPTAVTKPVLPPLQTPKTASFPSEICSTPMSACLSAVIKQEHDLKTPITPPTAYTDFLKALTPILATPPPSALQRSISDDSNASKDSAGSDGSFSAKSPTSASLPPPTPQSATLGTTQRRASIGLKRLRIPQHSPVFSPTSTTGPSPRTAISSSSVGMVFSPYSPADCMSSKNLIDSIASPRSACSKPVSVRSVVTRTVTYKRTTPNLEPAPKGKRRRTAGSSTCGSTISSNTSVASEDEGSRMPPPPLISVKESTPPEMEPVAKVEEDAQPAPVMADVPVATAP